MEQVMEVNVGKAKLKEFYKRGGKTVQDWYGKRLYKFRSGFIACFALATLLYALSWWIMVMPYVYGIPLILGLVVLYYYVTEREASKKYAKRWEDAQEGNWMFDTEMFHCVFDKEGIRYVLNEEIKFSEQWSNLSYVSFMQGCIRLYDSRNQAKLSLYSEWLSAKDFENIERFLKDKLVQGELSLHDPDYHPEVYKRNVVELTKYVFSWPISVMTLLLFSAALVLCVGFNVDTSALSLEKENRWGYFTYYDLLEGHYIGLVTSAILHIEFWHLLMNVYWLVVFGSKIEKEIGIGKYSLLFVSSTIVSSAFQILFSDQMGVGLSGVLYAYFGFIMISGYYSERFKYYIGQRDVQFFLVWLVICFFLTYFGIMNIGNGAHFSGFVWGSLIGFAANDSRRKYLAMVAMVCMVALSVLPLLWAPWSTTWLSYKAYEMHKADALEDAGAYYDKILEKDPDNKWAQENKKMLVQ